MRLGVLATHPIQYHAPLYRALAQRLDLEVFFAHRQTAEGQARAGFGVAFEWDVPLTEGYRHTYLVNRSRTPGTDSFSGCDTPGIGQVVRQGQFDAFLVNGWYTKSYLQAIVACWRTGTPLLVRGDSHLDTPRPGLVRAAKEIAYRAFIPRFDGYLVVGQRARDYYLHYGADPARFHFVPHFVDAGFFRSHASAADVAAVRGAIGCGPESLVLLFAGKFIAEKRPADVVRAAAHLAERTVRDVHVVMVGAGPLADEVRAEAARLGIRASFPGFQNQTEMPAWYAAADVLVLPSVSETWGLVVNEAMACGIPAVVSDAVGCAPDLIRQGETGGTFPVGDAAKAASSIERLLPQLGTDALAAALDQTTTTYSLETAVDGIMEAVESVSR